MATYFFHPRNKGFRVLCIAIGVTAAYTLGRIGWMIAVGCWHHPSAIPVVAAGVLGFAIFGYRKSCIHRAEVSMFQWRQPTADETFLEQVGIDTGTPEAVVALTARRVFAELGGIPSQSIGGDDRFYPDFARLPFYDSIDAVAILLELEEHLSITIQPSECERLFAILGGSPSCTVAVAAREVVKIWTTTRARSNNEIG